MCLCVCVCTHFCLYLQRHNTLTNITYIYSFFFFFFFFFLFFCFRLFIVASPLVLTPDWLAPPPQYQLHALITSIPYLQHEKQVNNARMWVKQRAIQDRGKKRKAQPRCQTAGVNSAALTFHHTTKKLLLVLHPGLTAADTGRSPAREGKAKMLSPAYVSPTQRCSPCSPPSRCLHLLPSSPSLLSSSPCCVHWLGSSKTLCCVWACSYPNILFLNVFNKKCTMFSPRIDALYHVKGLLSIYILKDKKD